MDRLTRRTDGGKVLLNKHLFPEYAEETLQREIASFPPFMQVMERLCEFGDRVNSENVNTI